MRMRWSSTSIVKGCRERWFYLGLKFYWCGLRAFTLCALGRVRGFGDKDKKPPPFTPFDRVCYDFSTCARYETLTCWRLIRSLEECMSFDVGVFCLFSFPLSSSQKETGRQRKPWAMSMSSSHFSMPAEKPNTWLRAALEKIFVQKKHRMLYIVSFIL